MQILRISVKSTDYPDKLRALADAPMQISVIGNIINLLKMPAVGIVGSRKVSAYGRSVTEELATVLARSGVCTISGLALGVDSIAHASALKANGKTIAILPGGIKQIYPSSHRGLARNIVTKGGLLISEYEDNFRPRKESFIQRNRIIAALSDVLLVTEAAEKSGSLHTANFALELGKTVMAVPGNISSPTSAGTNNLIKTGAAIFTKQQDIFDALNFHPGQLEQTDIYGDNEQESVLIKLLGKGINSGDELLIKSKLDVRLFQQTLSMLEIRGIITPLGNNHWRLK